MVWSRRLLTVKKHNIKTDELTMLNPQFYDRLWPIRLKQLSEKDTKGHSRGSNNQHSILSFEGFQNLRQILFKSLGVTLKERTRTNMVKTRSSMFGVPLFPWLLCVFISAQLSHCLARRRVSGSYEGPQSISRESVMYIAITRKGYHVQASRFIFVHLSRWLAMRVSELYEGSQFIWRENVMNVARIRQAKATVGHCSNGFVTLSVLGTFLTNVLSASPTYTTEGWSCRATWYRTKRKETNC